LLVGNDGYDDRPLGFDLDDLKVFASKTDSSGALSASDIQAIYAAERRSLLTGRNAVAIGVPGCSDALAVLLADSGFAAAIGATSA
jgi:hypothetical protein